MEQKVVFGPPLSTFACGFILWLYHSRLRSLVAPSSGWLHNTTGIPQRATHGRAHVPSSPKATSCQGRPLAALSAGFP